MAFRRLALAKCNLPLSRSNICSPSVRKFCSSSSSSGGSRTGHDYEHFSTLAVTQPADFVTQVVINRPDKANAMNSTLFAELRECFDKLALDPACRAVVICGSGKLFSAGLDLQEFAGIFCEVTSSGGASGGGGKDPGARAGQMQMDAARRTFANIPFLSRMQESLSSLQSCSKPVISAVHSACIGGGVDLVCAADIRLASSNAWFCIKEVDLGLCADLGTLQRLQKLVGSDSLVRELVFTARRFPAAEALQAGFVSKVLDTREELLDHAIGLASEIASRSPVAVQGSKVNLNYARDHPTAQALQFQALWSAAMLQTKDMPAALAAEVQRKSPPDFPPL